MRASTIAALALTACGPDLADDGPHAQRQDELVIIDPCLPHYTRPADVTLTIGPTNTQKSTASPNPDYQLGLFGLCRKFVVDVNVLADVPSHPIDVAAGAFGFQNTSNALDPMFPMPAFTINDQISKTHCESYLTSVTIYRKTSDALTLWKSATLRGEWNGSLCIPHDATKNIYGPDVGTILAPSSGSDAYRFLISGQVDGSRTVVGMRAKHSM